MFHHIRLNHCYNQVRLNLIHWIIALVKYVDHKKEFNYEIEDRDDKILTTSYSSYKEREKKELYKVFCLINIFYFFLLFIFFCFVFILFIYILFLFFYFFIFCFIIQNNCYYCCGALKLNCGCCSWAMNCCCGCWSCCIYCCWPWGINCCWLPCMYWFWSCIMASLLSLVLVV